MSPIKTISEKLNAWRRYRDAVRELSQLSDRELNDIGIRRGDIEDIVRRSVARKGRGLILDSLTSRDAPRKAARRPPGGARGQRSSIDNARKPS